MIYYHVLGIYSYFIYFNFSGWWSLEKLYNEGKKKNLLQYFKDCFFFFFPPLYLIISLICGDLNISLFDIFESYCIQVSFELETLHGCQ